MTEIQLARARNIFMSRRPREFHHGDCVGADAQMHTLAAEVGSRIVIHPPVDESHRARCVGDVVLERKAHFARNRDIVDVCDLLLATPSGMQELNYGGTWYTVRYARKKHRSVAIVWPDGTMTIETNALPVAGFKL